MISLLGSKITIPQGETGAIRYFFKDENDRPWILGPKPDGVEARIRFVVKAAPTNSSPAIFTKDFLIDIPAGDDDLDWHRFDSTEYFKLPEAEDIEENILYINEVSGAEEYIFYGEGNTQYNYDYINSSIIIPFDSEDTKNLNYKKYYYEISYLLGENVKFTLVPPTDFVVTGALN